MKSKESLQDKQQEMKEKWNLTPRRRRTKVELSILIIMNTVRDLKYKSSPELRGLSDYDFALLYNEYKEAEQKDLEFFIFNHRFYNF